MKKMMTYIIAAIMIMAAFMVVYDTFLYNDKTMEACLNEDLAAINALKQEGMRVLMIGGSNTDYNISEISMGYFIRTRNDDVIFVDEIKNIIVDDVIESSFKIVDKFVK